MEEVEVVDSDSTHFLSQLAADDILALIQKLPPGYRTVLNMYVLEDYSHKEIAQMLEISEGTSKSQLARAKALLASKLQKKGLSYGSAK
jgi:RNA polymerase sigma-70 factor (ECF subfamily)